MSVGGLLQWEVSRLRLHSDFTLLLPLSLTQTPSAEGAWEGLGWRTQLKASVVVNQWLALGIYGRYMRLGVELTGPAEYSDPFDVYTRYYTEASTMDSGLGGGLSVDLTF